MKTGMILQRNSGYKKKDCRCSGLSMTYYAQKNSFSLASGTRSFVNFFFFLGTFIITIAGDPKTVLKCENIILITK
jgi:hypothetical protein